MEIVIHSWVKDRRIPSFEEVSKVESANFFNGKPCLHVMNRFYFYFLEMAVSDAFTHQLSLVLLGGNRVQSLIVEQYKLQCWSPSAYESFVNFVDYCLSWRGHYVKQDHRGIRQIYICESCKSFCSPAVKTYRRKRSLEILTSMLLNPTEVTNSYCRGLRLRTTIAIADWCRFLAVPYPRGSHEYYRHT